MTQDIEDLKKEISDLRVELVQIRTSLENALQQLANGQTNFGKIVELEKIDSRQQGQLNLICGILGIFAPFLIAGCIYMAQTIVEVEIRNEILQERVIQLENKSKNLSK